MGLDMYIEMDGDEIAYWRKANQIHGWFERRFPELENGVYIPLTWGDLTDLLDDLIECAKEIANRGTPDHLCKDKLPTTEGFFYGSYEYDDWYVDDIFESVSKVLKCMCEMTKNPNAQFTYMAWW